MRSGFRVSGFGFRVPRFRDSGFGIRDSGFGIRVPRFRVPGSEVSGFGVLLLLYYYSQA